MFYERTMGNTENKRFMWGQGKEGLGWVKQNQECIKQLDETPLVC